MANFEKLPNHPIRGENWVKSWFEFSRWLDIVQRTLRKLEIDSLLQYFHLAGRTGGQVAAGGSGASDDLTLLSTASATKGEVHIGGDGVTDTSTFEDDGTLRFDGDAVVWDDIHFPQSPPKTVGAGNPTLVTFLGNLRGYAYAVGDAHDFDPQEYKHNGKQGAQAVIHIHFVTRSTVGTDTAIKWEVEFSTANVNTVFPTPTVASAEVVIPGGTPALTHVIADITTFTAGNIASQMFMRVKRVAAAGVAPATDPVIVGVHYHYQIDTAGSRQIFSK